MPNRRAVGHPDPIAGAKDRHFAGGRYDGEFGHADLGLADCFDRMPYAASKAAIVQISEGLALYLRPKNIGVTLLCPGPVLTNIASNMPTFGGGAALRTPGEQFELFDAARVGELVADAILQNRVFVPTHPQVTDELRRRVETGMPTWITKSPANPWHRKATTHDRRPRTDGLAVFKDLLPGLIPDEVTSMRDDGFAGELGELSLEHVFGALWTRPGLDRRVPQPRHTGALIALRAGEELTFHFPIALRNGLTAEELEEVVYHLTGYVGFPAATLARNVGRAGAASAGPSIRQLKNATAIFLSGLRVYSSVTTYRLSQPPQSSWRSSECPGQSTRD